ncbi:MAG: hypothetical protein IIT86_06250, partial [Oscillospiraceae bacterium]|nr:hypothetical protein [Oscillospiraceae bacterium]
MGLLLSKKRPLFPGLDPDAEAKKPSIFQEEPIMKKQEKFTQAYFNEADPMMEITTHNTDL